MVAFMLNGLVGFPAGLSPTSFHLSPTSFHLSPRWCLACGPLLSHFLAFVSHFLLFVSHFFYVSGRLVSHFFPKQFTAVRCVRPLCQWWCPPISAGHVAFLFICLPGLPLLVSALFCWPCSISIHVSPRSVTGGVCPFPLVV